MKKIISVIMCIVLTAGVFSGCSVAKTEEKYSGFMIDSFDTLISVISFQPSQEKFDELMEFAESEYKRLNNLYDIYNTYPDLNNAKTINDNAGIAPVKVSEDLFNLIKFSIDWYYKTDGKVNIAMGSVLKIWHDIREKAEAASISGEDLEQIITLPSMEELEAANEHCLIENIVLDEENMTVYITDPKTQIDLGAIAKGYATELICDKLSEKYDNFAISAGGNVKVHGAPKDERTRWAIGIQDPKVDENFKMSGGNIDLAYLAGDLSLVCSGGYQRFFVYDGERYHHLIDPETLYPANYYLGVTVLCEDSGMADALSTAIFMMESDEALEFINSIENTECILVLNDGTQLKTDGFDKYLESCGVTNTTPVE